MNMFPEIKVQVIVLSQSHGSPSPCVVLQQSKMAYLQILMLIIMHCLCEINVFLICPFPFSPFRKENFFNRLCVIGLV